MDVNAIGSMATEMSQNRLEQAVQLTVLKKANDMQGQSVLQLIQSVTQSSSNNPPNLGNAIDTIA